MWSFLLSFLPACHDFSSIWEKESHTHTHKKHTHTNTHTHKHTHTHTNMHTHSVIYTQCKKEERSFKEMGVGGGGANGRKLLETLAHFIQMVATVMLSMTLIDYPATWGGGGN